MSGLSSDEIRRLREELAAGSTPTVWFTGAAVGVPEGRSGKVIALDDPAEGDFIQVRPAGSKDVLSFSAGEATLVKPPRKRADSAASAPAKAEEPRSQRSRATAAAQPKPSAPEKPAAAPSSASDKPSGGARRKERRPSGATVTLAADEAGQWNVEVSTGKKRVLRPTPVPASAVAHAAQALHEDVAEAVKPLIEAAREQQRARVEQLRKELADAQRMLDELTE